MLQQTIGIIGGTGWIGSSFVKSFLSNKLLPEQQLWVSNQSGELGVLADHTSIHITTDSNELIQHCDVVILSVRPQQFYDLQIDLSQHLVISVMAGVSIEQTAQHSNATRIIRSMPNAACLMGQSFTAWYPSQAVSNADKHLTQTILQAVGAEGEVATEEQVGILTAVAGCAPGMLAFFVDAYIQAATDLGIDPGLADKAARQAFVGASCYIQQDSQTPEQSLEEQRQYNGATYAGIKALQQSDAAEVIKSAITAAYRKASGDMTSDSTQD